MTRPLLLITLGLSALAGMAQASAAKAPSSPAPTQADAGFADIFLTARRVVLEGGHRSMGVSLMNASAHRNTYRIVINYRDMDADGQLTERQDPKPSDRNWKDLLRFSPRQFVLDSGESQLVRLSFSPIPDLPDGEYRYFINFQLLPHTPDPVPSSQDTAEAINLQVLPTYALAIPVIYRKGNVQAQVQLSDISFLPGSEEKAPVLRVKLSRTGNASSYGHIRALWVPNQGGEEEVSLMKGVAVYAENDHRWVSLELHSASGRPFTAGRLRVTYTADGKKNAGSQVEIPVP